MRLEKRVSELDAQVYVIGLLLAIGECYTSHDNTVPIDIGRGLVESQGMQILKLI